MDKDIDGAEGSPILSEREPLPSQGSTNYGAIADDEVEETPLNSQSPQQAPQDTEQGQANTAFEGDDEQGKQGASEKDSITKLEDGQDIASIAPSVTNSEAPLVTGDARGGDGGTPPEGGGPGSGDGKVEEGEGEKKELEEKDEAWYRILGEIVGPFLLAGFGMVLAGYLLGIIQVI